MRKIPADRRMHADHGQWRFYVEARGHSPPNLAPSHKFNTGQLDTVVLLLVDVIGCIVISLCCLPNDEGLGPQIFFPRTAPPHGRIG